ncbi:uncharacterized protein LOC133287682 [Gastrolobium bilobum]|uniref:uncharacterized protein LOC133287682 n=1 Tax=Gastrolobium bilobum TaxID=150636 RepID=UPI002AAF5492|nr:uncharacterized protein LOC133287682 [Gastrolobium bilobum]
MPALRKRSRTAESAKSNTPQPENGNHDQQKISLYELSREQRIRENRERMGKLGIVDLSLSLKLRRAPTTHKTTTIVHPSGPVRRSSRLQNVSPVSYSEVPHKKAECLENAKVVIKAGSKPEVYTEEHEKLLGNTEKSWTLFVDGYGKDGKRIYDSVLGKSCHQCRCIVFLSAMILYLPLSRHALWFGLAVSAIQQLAAELGGSLTLGRMFQGVLCSDGAFFMWNSRMKIIFRQKTLGYRTCCIQCNMVQGQFCGDCLYMRYGEHVLEALQNPTWICPVCRGICNCSLCRQAKGWAPTGTLYKKISALGYKSVAHYLIQTRRSDVDEEKNADSPNPVSAKRSLTFSDGDVNEFPEVNGNHLGSLKPIAETKSDDDVVSAKRLLVFSDKQEQLDKVECSGTMKLLASSSKPCSDSIAGRLRPRLKKP